MGLTIEDVAGRAGVDVAYVRRLVDLGALGPEGDGFREQDAHVTALIHMWEEAGLTAESILAAAGSGELSLDFLESPGWELPPRLDRTYRRLAEERGMPVDLLLAIHRAIGFVPPEPDDLAGPDDVVIADLARMALDIGGSEDAIRRLFRVYADNLRRLALAEADLYIEQIERPSRSAGTSEPELMRRGAGVGRDMAPLVRATLAAIYERHRQHVGHSIPSRRPRRCSSAPACTSGPSGHPRYASSISRATRASPKSRATRPPPASPPASPRSSTGWRSATVGDPSGGSATEGCSCSPRRRPPFEQRSR